MNGYLTGQSAWLLNYAERHRAGLRVGTAITEGTANFLVDRRMSKSQQMRWSRRGVDLLLWVRRAVYNGTLGSGFGQKCQPANKAGTNGSASWYAQSDRTRTNRLPEYPSIEVSASFSFRQGLAYRKLA